MLIDFQSGKNRDVANAKKGYTLNSIDCDREKKLLNFTTKVLPKLCFKKQLIEDGMNFQLLSNENEIDTEAEFEKELKNHYYENCDDRYRKANKWLYEILKIRQLIINMFEVTDSVDTMINNFCIEYGVKENMSDFIESIQNEWIKSNRDNQYFDSNFEKKLITENNDLQLKTYIKNDKKLCNCISMYKELLGYESENEYDLYASNIDMLKEVNSYYGSCFVACHDLYKKFDVLVF
jgi:hypothetical protein